jgi:hypothetical protein
MLIWLCLLIPLIGAIVLLKWYKHTLVWWEVLVPLVSCFFFILIFKFTVEKIQTSDTEYKGALIVEARYYEYWETYVRKTCYRTHKVGKTTVTTSYDCSYCDHNPEHWTMINSLGQEFSITKEHYEKLRKLWNSTPQFLELNRNINTSFFGCGQDGDAYVIRWNLNPLTSRSTTESNTYDNRVQAAHSAFDFLDVSEEDVKRYKLFEYPEIKGNTQENVLGLDSMPYIPKNKIDTFKILAHYLNGKLGPEKHARIYFLFFEAKDQLSASMQEAYWDGGNDNELVICIGIDPKTQNLNWVKPFSWTPNRQVIPEIREEIMGIGKFDPVAISNRVEGVVRSKYKRKDFREFSYLSVDPPGWSIWVTAILTAIITFLLSRWAAINDIGNEGDTEGDFFSRKRTSRW